MHEHILLFDDSYAYYVVARHLFSKWKASSRTTIWRSL